ncbi:hypothetical protein [Streptomyces sp. NPDC057403]|uniref:hypothetical protein n=1 Tax=Streptomyces sp. NPDC057403 TaxID=3346119 RepID=UPI003676FC8E
MRQRDVHDELRARLHEAAEAHEPDRARMLARIERGMGPETDRAGHRATRTPVWGWVRVVGATTAVAGMLAVGGYAVASAVKDDAPPQQTVAVSPTPAPSPDATSRAPVPPVEPAPSRTPGTHRPSGTPSPTRPSASVTVPPSAGGESDGPLRSDGSVDPHSNDFWAQSDITLRTSARLTSLVVQLKVAQNGGVSDTGAWRSLPEQDFDLAVGERDGFLVYTWTLKAGRTVPTGEWVFAGQYNHQPGGRDAKDDGYTIRATAEGRQRTVAGGFAAHTGGADGS